MLTFDFIQYTQATDVSHTTTRDDSLFNCGAGSMQGILDTGFLFFHFRLGCGTYFDDGYATH